jgi:NADH-quinone oxidoreductase subunit G
MATVEELHLLAKLVRGLGSENVDTRLRETRAPGGGAMRWLGRSIASLAELQRVLVVGSFLRKDHPLFAQRLRQATKKGAKVMSVHALHDDWLMPMGPSIAAAPSAWPEALASIAAAVAAAKGSAAPVQAPQNDQAKAIAAALLGGEQKAVLLGNAAAQHADAALLERLGRWIAGQTGATFGWLGDGANAVGAQLVGANARAGGRSAGQMLSAAAPLKACLLLHVEPSLDAADGKAARAALRGAELVVALSAFQPHPDDDVADVLLPIAPFSETSGTFVNAEGRVQSFHGVVKPFAETRPAWKVLRVLGNLLGLAGFSFETSEEVRAEALGDEATIAVRLAAPAPAEGGPIALPAARAGGGGLERIADVPIYASDPIVRRAPALQRTVDARPPAVGVPSELAAERGIVDGARVRVTSAHGSVVLPARVDPSLAADVLRVAAAQAPTVALGPMNARLELVLEQEPIGNALPSAA